jgi:hypothetical protein
MTPPNVLEGMAISAPNDGQSEWFTAEYRMENMVINNYY